MSKEKRDQEIARGKARWQASRLEGVVKNRGIKKKKKHKGMRKERRMRKVTDRRVSKRK